MKMFNGQDVIISFSNPQNVLIQGLICDSDVSLGFVTTGVRCLFAKF
jgi:hypothetical protein